MQTLHKVLIWALASLACLAPFVVLFTLPIFNGGIFTATETVAVGIHVIACLTAFLLLCMSVVSVAGIRAAINQGVLSIAAIALVSSCMISFSAYPSRDVYGTLGHGIGILWYVETALMAVGFGVAWAGLPRARLAIAWSSLGSVVLCAALEVLHVKTGSGMLMPHGTPGYLGLDAMIGSVPLLCLKRRPTTYAAVAGVLVCTATNASLGVCLALLSFFVLSWILKNNSSRAKLRELFPAGSVAATVFLACVIALSAPVLQSLATFNVDAMTNPQVPSVSAIDHIIMQDEPYGSLWQRSISARLAFEHMARRPSSFATGEGFGSFETVAETESRSVPGRRMAHPTETSSLTYWDSDHKLRHSQNAVVEALLSAGVLGVIVFLAFIWVIAKKVASTRTYGALMFLSFMVVGTSIFFVVNAVAPLMALAVATLFCDRNRSFVDDTPPLTIAQKGFASFVTLVCAALGLVTAASAAFAYTTLKGERFELQFEPLPVLTCQGYSALTMPNRDIDRSLYAILTRRIVDKGVGASEEAMKDKFIIANYSCLLRKHSEAGDILSTIESLKDRYELYNSISGTAMPTVLNVDFKQWGADIDWVLKMAPGRTDLIVPYVSWLGTRNDPKLIHEAEALFNSRLREGDPIKVWLHGQVAKADGDTAEWASADHQAMRQGFANLFPVTKSALDSIHK